MKVNSILIVLVAALLILSETAGRSQMVTGHQMTNFDQAFGLNRPEGTDQSNLRARYLSSNIPGNILWPQDHATFTIEVDGLASVPDQTTAAVDVVSYGTKGTPGDVWTPIVYKIADVNATQIQIKPSKQDAETITVSPEIPEKFGAYALIFDAGSKGGRQFLVSCVRTFKPSPDPVQYPALSLDNLGPDVLGRLGVHAIRWGISYKPTTDPDFSQWYAYQCSQLKRLKQSNISVLAMFGAGAETGPTQPLGRGRPHLDSSGNMLPTKEDLAWLPSYDPDFRKFVAKLCRDYGWPKGPITACSLWNEPWEGSSISGWGADTPRYRTIYSAMAAGVHDARSTGSDVLIGGCDSSSNALDKLFSDGKNTYLPDFDFLSVHYQGMESFATYKPWVNRKSPEGRVRIWDTESWIANTDDRVAAVIATNRSAGYDRAMGIFGGNISDSDPHGSGGGNTWSVAAAVGAATHFIGERSFKTLLFKNGLPWVFVFDGRQGNAEDGTVVIVGDIGDEFGPDNILFRTARGENDALLQQSAYQKLLQLSPADADKIVATSSDGKPISQRAYLTNEMNVEDTLSGASMTIDGHSGAFSLYDAYGNPDPSESGLIHVPLNGSGYFLRGDGRPGSFAKLLNAIRNSQIRGIEPVATVAHDLTAPISTHPDFVVDLNNVLNHPVSGELNVSLGDLRLDEPIRHVTVMANETLRVRIRVVGGPESASNTYPLALKFDGGTGAVAVHYENMHVNVIAQRTINVDGNLSDWTGVLPETITSPIVNTPSLTETAWYPYKKFTANEGQGIASAYLAYDRKYFYFAAKVADSTPDGGTLRFADRDDNTYFYPKVSYGADGRSPLGPGNTPPALLWPAGVRNYSYRKDPILPAGDSPDFDNVLIAFNVVSPSKKWYYPNPPGTMPDYTINLDSDYEYALNQVADAYGGGTEIWRLRHPGMPLKNFYPREPESPEDGPVVNGKLVIVNNAGTRIVEAAIPWSEIPDVHNAMLQHLPIKFSYRANDNAGDGCMELSRGRSVAKNGGSFDVGWVEHWENQVQFGWGN